MTEEAIRILANRSSPAYSRALAELRDELMLVPSGASFTSVDGSGDPAQAGCRGITP